MEIQLEKMLPAEIEQRSWELIAQELEQFAHTNGMTETLAAYSETEMAVLKRVIHTTADFEYARNLVFQNDALRRGIQAIQNGASIVTDTQMVKAGINKKVLQQFGGKVHCFIADEDVAQKARQEGTTRSQVSMEKALQLKQPLIFAIGNAPTALIRLYQLIETEQIQPELVVAVPVGFVNVLEAKELLSESPVPAIIAKGRKGGSNVAAAICNALLYCAGGKRV